MKNSIFCLLFLLVMQSACYRDKGNYDYTEINKIQISFDPEDASDGFYNCYTSDILNITPVLAFKETSESNLTYTWYCNNEVISNERVLDYPVSRLTGVRPYVKLKVTNNADGANYVSGFYCEIIPAYMTGWVVLTKNDKGTSLSFINPSNYSVYPDFYTTMNGHNLGANAIEVKEHWPNSPTTIGDILIVRHEEQGNIELDGEDLSPLYATNDYFIGKQTPADFRPVGEYYMWDYSFMLDDNHNLYMRKFDNSKVFQSGVYTNKPMYFSGDVAFTKAWAGTWFCGLTIFYDENKGCIYVGSDFGSVLKVSFVNVRPGMPGNYTFIDNMDKKLVYVGNCHLGRYTSNFVSVYKDNTGNYWVQKFMLQHNGTICNAIHNGEQQFGDGNINDQSVFCQFVRRSDYMIYSGGSNNKTLYLYSHPTKSSSEYYQFDSPIRSITVNLDASKTEKVAMVGLENGDFYFLGVEYDHFTNTKERLLKKVELGQGVPVSAFYKCGYTYTQY